MKRKVLVIVIAVVVAASIFVSAAAMNISAVTLGEGTSTVESCNGATPLTTTYETQWSQSANAFVITRVDVAGILAACNAKQLDLVLTDATNAQVAGGTATVVAPVDGSTQAIDLTPTPATDTVTAVHVVISG